MTVSTLRLELRVAHCHTPGEARRQMRTIMAKLHRSFNVSVAAADRSGDPGAVMLLVAAVGPTRRQARETLERVADAVAAHPRAEVLGNAITEV